MDDETREFERCVCRVRRAALERIQAGRDLIESGERILAILALCTDDGLSAHSHEPALERRDSED